MTSQHPLRLAVGSHQAGSGKGCVMNLISWENGDTTITDMPMCADRMLSKIMHSVNDKICTHRDGDLLCPACSQIVLKLGYRIVGTGDQLRLSVRERRIVCVRVAVAAARSVHHLNPDPRAAAAIDAAERWCDDPTFSNANKARAAAILGDEHPAVSVAYATGPGHYDHAARAVLLAAGIAAAKSLTKRGFRGAAATPCGTYVAQVNAAIDEFQRLTGHATPAADPASTVAAVRQMQTIA